MSAAEASHEPPLRVMSLHSLLYCPRLFYLEEVEGIYLADDHVFAGRELHTSLDAEAQEMGHAESLDLVSEELGLRGKVDVIKRRDGVYVP